jgi:hypothetical protein
LLIIVEITKFIFDHVLTTHTILTECPERTTDHGQATGKLYHLRVECILFCNLQSRARTHVVLVIGLYELLRHDRK